MSSEATTWAIHQTVGDPCRKLILFGIANVASRSGEHSFPSVKELAEDAECSTRSVQRHLRILESDALITRGDQRFVEHIRADRRPVVWDLPMPRGDNMTPRGESRGDTEGGHGVTNGEIAPHIETIETNADEFLAFYECYPKHVGKDSARKAWRSALKRVEDSSGRVLEESKAVSKLMVRARRYATLCQAREKQYIKAPASWLNGGHWEDEDLLPGRWNGSRPVVDGPNYDAEVRY